ncbi:uncharacterized protein [Gossypium hirsutum]|uniref:Reverse transcriptase domain-containing protein n=1 Tax=Gossypium hirsutum TaxID=3635 RepID=A0A1U8LVS7_GOSHI|nr:uncharacterized protein LOC107931322 [Gossypium hirsutum]
MKDFQAYFGHVYFGHAYFGHVYFGYAYFGHVLTLSNHKLDRPIVKKLERVLVNAAWLRFLPHSWVEFATLGCSDHCTSIVWLERPPTMAKAEELESFQVALLWDDLVRNGPIGQVRAGLLVLQEAESSGNRLESFDQISAVVLGFCQNLLGTVDSNVVECLDFLLQELLPKLFNNAHRVLNIPITNKEINVTIFGQGNEKAPGLDSFMTFFFKSAWSIVGPNFFKSVCLFRGRSITDNTILAHELMRGYGRRHISPRCALKVDLQKTFDYLHWAFLLSILRAQGFLGKFLKWTEVCLTTPRFFVSLNGSLVEFFRGRRGIRQGDPLCPYLFVLAMNVLSKLLDVATINDVFKDHLKCLRFYLVSRLQLNASKSELFVAEVPQKELVFMTTCIGFKVGRLPMRYLGVPLISRKLSRSNCADLTNRILDKIQGWSTKHLSYAGRLQLIKAMIFSVEAYWIRQFLMHKIVLKKERGIFGLLGWSFLIGSQLEITSLLLGF